MTVNKLPLELDAWVPHAIHGQYRRDMVERIPRALMRTLLALHNTARPRPTLVAEMKSPRVTSTEEDLLQRAVARALHDLAVIWELPLEIYIGTRPIYNDPGATLLVRLETEPDPDSYGPARPGGPAFYRGTVHRLTASNLAPLYPF